MPCGPRLGRLRTFLLGRRGCKVQEETRYNHSSIAKLAVAEECLASAFRPQTFSRACHCGAEDGRDEIDCLMGTSPPLEAVVAVTVISVGLGLLAGTLIGAAGIGGVITRCKPGRRSSLAQAPIRIKASKDAYP